MKFKWAFIALMLVSSLSFSNNKPLSSDLLIMDRVKLAEMYARDQAVRYEILASAKKGRSISPMLMSYWLSLDRENTRDLKVILNRWGWPTKTLFSEAQRQSIFMLVQHADQDVKFQEDMLQKMKKRMGNNRFDLSRYAYLWDRVMVHKKQPQRFGTQGVCVAHHVWNPNTIEDPVHLEQRRLKYGLFPFSEYSRFMQTQCP